MTTQEVGIGYKGAVSGVEHQIMLTWHTVGIVGVTPNSFILTGYGNDTIDVSRSGGTNSLNAGSGKNVVTGGAGADTIVIDTAATRYTADTLVNFGKGDVARLVGMTPQNRALLWVDGVDAHGVKNLTLHALAAGKPEVAATFVGYSKADLARGGHLALSFDSTGGQIKAV